MRSGKLTASKQSLLDQQPVEAKKQSNNNAFKRFWNTSVDIESRGQITWELREKNTVVTNIDPTLKFEDRKNFVLK